METSPSVNQEARRVTENYNPVSELTESLPQAWSFPFSPLCTHPAIQCGLLSFSLPGLPSYHLAMAMEGAGTPGPQVGRAWSRKTQIPSGQTRSRRHRLQQSRSRKRWVSASSMKRGPHAEACQWAPVMQTHRAPAENRPPRAACMSVGSEAWLKCRTLPYIQGSLSRWLTVNPCLQYMCGFFF
jgi:hypothetical protein